MCAHAYINIYIYTYKYTGNNIIKLKKNNPDLRLHGLTQGACGFQADRLQVVPLGLATGVHHNIADVSTF